MSTRMGRTKATLRLTGGETFVGRIIRTFHDAGVHETIVVLGHDATAVASAVYETGLGARVVLNRDYEAGQLSSGRPRFAPSSIGTGNCIRLSFARCRATGTAIPFCWIARCSIGSARPIRRTGSSRS